MSNQGQQAGRVPLGGPATINGVVYQILWSLLRASRARPESQVTDETGALSEVTLTLEPVGGGGDLVVAEAGHRTVEQLKSRPDGGTWSLREIVEDVVPDLYLACDKSTAETDFRFVTEGRMGRWNKVYEFFQGLRNRGCPEDDVLSTLKDDCEVSFGRRTVGADANLDAERFWDREVYTERTLYERIVAEVRKRKPVRDNEDEATTRRRLWHLLANFEFVGEQGVERVQREIDTHLLAVVDVHDEIPRIRDAMAMDLARRAASGDAEIDVADFFRHHELDATPLNHWSRLRDSAHRHLDAYLNLRGYDRDLDVRFFAAAETLEQWPEGTPMLTISGESGQGKSWRAFAMSIHSGSGQELTVAIDATGNADHTLDRAARAVWQQIAGHDQVIPIHRIADRIRRVLSGQFGRWLTLMIDGIQDVAEATALVREPWEDYGVRVLFTVHPRVAAQMERESFGRCLVSSVGDFNLEELHRYLDLCLGENWPGVPDYLKYPLRRPLLASLYREIVDDLAWRPESEYEVYAAYWRRLVEVNQLDGALIKRLVRRFLDGATYPWRDHDLTVAGADESAIRRLERAGWLRVVFGPTDVQFEIAHDRLLNWVVAALLVGDLHGGPVTIEQLGEKLHGFLSGRTTIGGRHLGCVPMDALWMMISDESLSGRASDLLTALERDFGQIEDLYTELVPTLGPPAAEALYQRLQTATNDGWLVRYLADAIARIETGSTLATVWKCLHGDEPLLQRAAMRIMAKRPSADALDRLWELHLAGVRTPERFLREHENRYTLYEESFEALRECCRLNPGWLDGAIEEADPTRDPVHDLAYLVAAVRGDEGANLWRRNKATLFQKVSAGKLRSIATCIGCYADTDELDWLLAHVPQTQDQVGAKAMSALARIAPAVAVEHLHELPRRELVLARSWYADHLFAACPGQMQSKLLEMMQSEDSPWEVAQVYSGREHRLDASTLDFLLDDLDRRLEDMLAIPNWGAAEPLYVPLCLLARVNTCVGSERLHRRQGTSLESNLCEFLLRIGPQQGRAQDSLVRDEATEVLYRIGGKGFMRIVNEFLTADSRYARLDAIELAAKRSDAETVRRLTAICDSEGTWEGTPLEQNYSARILGELGEWEPVLRTVERIGLQVFSDVTDFARRNLRPPSALLAGARSAIDTHRAGVTPGTVLVLGFGSALEDSATIRDILANCEPESDLAHACVIALDMLRDTSEESVSLLARQLGIRSHEFSATNALIVNGTQAALQALREHVPGQFNVAIAVNLMNRLESPGDAVQEIGDALERKLRDPGWPEFSITLDRLLKHVSNDNLVQQLTGSRPIREHVRAAAFADEGKGWFVGSKAAAIRCLARFDAQAAFLAARTALRTPYWHDREQYPYILMDIDPERAIPILADQLTVEQSQNVTCSICRALLAVDVDSRIAERLESRDATIRRAACTLAGWAGRGGDLKSILRRRLEDEDEGVAREAVKAMDRWELRHEAQRLGEAILAEQDPSNRWISLDCLLALADPGDAHRVWAVEGPMIGDVLSPLQISHATHRLGKLRRKSPSE